MHQIQIKPDSNIGKRSNSSKADRAEHAPAVLAKSPPRISSILGGSRATKGVVVSFSMPSTDAALGEVKAPPELKAIPAPDTSRLSDEELRLLGQCYMEGKYVEQDYTKALNYLTQASANSKAQLLIGVMRESGWGCTPNPSEAVIWYRRAAANGDLQAISNLGLSYAIGSGVKKDLAAAYRLYKKAAEAGDMVAQYNLAGCYAEGAGITKDLNEALKWFAKAASQGDVDAQCDFDLYSAMLANPEASPGKPDFNTMLKAAIKGSATAQFFVGLCYDKGDGTSKDMEQALIWYTAAADQGYADAQFNLGHLYMTGEGVAKSESEAAKWFKEAANQGHANAQMMVGLYLWDGLGWDKNPTEAVKWIRQAAAANCAQALEWLESNSHI